MSFYIPFKIKVVPNRVLKKAKNIVYKTNRAKAMTMTKITINILIIMVILRVRCTFTLYVDKISLEESHYRLSEAVPVVQQ